MSLADANACKDFNRSRAHHTAFWESKEPPSRTNLPTTHYCLWIKRGFKEELSNETGPMIVVGWKPQSRMSFRKFDFYFLLTPDSDLYPTESSSGFVSRLTAIFATF
jgi:hypothetical protein